MRLVVVVVVVVVVAVAVVVVAVVDVVDNEVGGGGSCKEGGRESDDAEGERFGVASWRRIYIRLTELMARGTAGSHFKTTCQFFELVVDPNVPMKISSRVVSFCRDARCGCDPCRPIHACACACVPIRSSILPIYPIPILPHLSINPPQILLTLLLYQRRALAVHQSPVDNYLTRASLSWARTSHCSRDMFPKALMLFVD